MRYVIYGAGSIGGFVGSRLHAAGHDVILIVRGARLQAMREHGVRVRVPGAAEETYRIPVVAGPEEASVTGQDVVFMTMGTHDQPAALAALRAVTEIDTPIVTTQNTIECQRMALRLFRNVYGMYTNLPAEHVEPGVVSVHSPGQPYGALDLGRYPQGTDGGAERIADDLRSAGFASRTVADISRWKYGKLHYALGNAVKAVCGQGPLYAEIVGRARAEAVACFAAAGIAYATIAELDERRKAVSGKAGTLDAPGSGWSSLLRGSGGIETDYINGEIVLLGRLHGVPTPVNETIQPIAAMFARERRRPESMPLEALHAAIAETDGRLAAGRA